MTCFVLFRISRKKKKYETVNPTDVDPGSRTGSALSCMRIHITPQSQFKLIGVLDKVESKKISVIFDFSESEQYFFKASGTRPVTLKKKIGTGRVIR